MTGGPRAFRRPAPRTGSPPARIGGTDPTDDANLGADALIAKGEAAVRLGRFEQANEAFAAARAITAAEKTRGSPPSFAGLGDAPHDALEAKAAECDAASEAKAAECDAAATGEAETQKRIKDATIADLRAELRLAEEAAEAQRRRAEDAGGKLRVAESETAAATLARS